MKMHLSIYFEFQCPYAMQMLPCNTFPEKDSSPSPLSFRFKSFVILILQTMLDIKTQVSTR